MVQALRLPILRQGQTYESLQTQPLLDHRSGEVLANVSQANTGLIIADMLKTAEIRHNLTRDLSTSDAIAICQEAAELFLHGDLPCGDMTQSPDDFVRQQSATTAMPEAMCRINMGKIYRAMKFTGNILRSLTMNLDFGILDQGYGHQGRSYDLISYLRPTTSR